MATLPALHFMETAEAQIDDLLMRICRRLQLDDTRFSQAETSYHAVGDWIESQPHTRILRPTIYSQGSMLLKTTVKPLAGDEYDLDFVCEFDCTTAYFRDPVDALDLIERTLRSNLTYAAMVERKKRCIRLNYANKFHLDVLPACADPRRGETCILIPDRELGEWTASNPRGYAAWFASCARRRFVHKLLEKAEPLPRPECAEQKLPLERSVQLLKRWRDVRYRQNPKIAPPSILLTTLAAQHYRGDQSVALAMFEILHQINDEAENAGSRIVVLNPQNPDEDFSERWNEQPAAYAEFVGRIAEFNNNWSELLRMRGTEKIAKALESMFGESVAKQAVTDQLREIEAARSRSQLSIHRASGLVTVATGASVKPIPTNTFFGDEKS